MDDLLNKVLEGLNEVVVGETVAKRKSNSGDKSSKTQKTAAADKPKEEEKVVVKHKIRLPSLFCNKNYPYANLTTGKKE